MKFNKLMDTTEIHATADQLKDCKGNMLQAYVYRAEIVIAFSPLIGEPISYHCSVSVLPENIRKPEVFWCFQGV